MPGFRTHYLFGRISDSNLGLQYNSIKRHPTVYNLGQQGPDIFFYCPPSHLFYKEHLGARIHKHDTLAFFSSLFEGRNRFLSREDKQICDAYIMGFMGHYTLDTIVHPYVHYRAKKTSLLDREEYAYGIHVLLETDIDNALVRHFLHINPGEFDAAASIRLSKREQGIVSLLLAFAIRRTYPGLFASAAHVSLAIDCTRIANKFMSGSPDKLKSLVRMIDERLVGNAYLSALIPSDNLKTYNDPCNISHYKWLNPWDADISSTESVYDLLKRAEKDYRIRLSLYHDMMVRLPESYFYCQNTLLGNLGNLSYDSGLELIN